MIMPKHLSKARTRACGIIPYPETVAHKFVKKLSEPWTRSIDIDQADSVFSGISTFGRIEYSPCLATDTVKYDIAFIGKNKSCCHVVSFNLTRVFPQELPSILVEMSQIDLKYQFTDRHRHILQTRCTIRSVRNKAGQSPIESLVRFTPGWFKP